MWAIRVLTGKSAGQVFPLKNGVNNLGRSPQCHIVLTAQGISKKHAQIMVTEDKVIISDLQSSNGTFVNGTRIQNHSLKPGDKFTINDIIFDIFLAPNSISFKPALRSSQQGKELTQFTHAPPPMEVPQNQGSQASSENLPTLSSQKAIKDRPIQEQFEYYVDEVAMPGIYQLTEVFDFRYVMLGFVLSFIFIVTILSVIPVNSVIREHVISESERRAVTIARRLADFNRQAILDQNLIATNIDTIKNEQGVDQAYIVSSTNGDVIAPTNLMGQYLKIPFIHGARKSFSETTEVLDDDRLAVSVPISVYSPELGEKTNLAHVIVFFNMNKTALGFQNTLSIFVQILVIAFLAGAILYFILFKVVRYPIDTVNRELDKALKEGLDNITINVKFSALEKLVANINSTLSRMGSGSGGGDIAVSGDKTMESEEIVNMIPVGAFAIKPEDQTFMAVNETLFSSPLFDERSIQGKRIDDLTDPSLVESLKDLLRKAEDNPNLRHSNVIPGKGSEAYDITVKAILEGGKTTYLLFVVTEVYQEEEKAG